MIKILKFKDTTLGLFAHFKLVISALDKIGNDKLYVDFSKISSYYDQTYLITDNVWEYFFEQPFNLIKENLQKEETYTYKDIGEFWSLGYKNNTFDYPKEEITRLREVCKKYIKLKSPIQIKIDNFYQNNMQGLKILGVQKRGTSHYSIGHGYNQQHLINTDYFFSKIDEIIDSYDKVFLITDEQATVNEFREKYKEKLIHYDNAVLSNDEKEIHNNCGKNKYKTGEDVVIETFLLSKCSFLLAISSNLSSSAILLNENLLYKYIDKHIVYN